MAVIVSSPWSTIRGSIAGTTYFTTPSGQIIARQRTIPVNPKTSNQTTIRSAFAQAVGAWEALTDAVREDWDDYAASLGTGQSGRQIFIGNYSLAVYANTRSTGFITLGTGAPDNPGVLPFGPVEAGTFATAGQTGVAINVENPNTEDVVAITEISRVFGPGRARFKGPFKSSTFTLTTLTGLTVTTIPIQGLVAGGIYFIRVRGIDEEAGFRISAESIIRAIAVTNP